MTHPPRPTLERFERSIVFRGGRVMPLGLAALATLTVAAATVALAYSFVPDRLPVAPPAVAPPPPVAVSLAEVRAFRAAGGAGAAPAAGAPAASAQDPSAVALAAELGRVHALFERRGLPWADRHERVCRYRSAYFGTCFDWETRRVASGQGAHVEAVLALYDEAGSAPQGVTLREGGRERRTEVDASNAGIKVAALKEIQAILGSPQITEPGRAVRAWAQLRTEREAARRSQHESRVAATRTAYLRAMADYENAVARKRELRGSALSGIGVALLAFMAFGMVLAVFAIERNTRALGAVRGGPGAPARVPVPGIAGGAPA